MTLGAIGRHFGSFLAPFEALLVILAPFWYQNHSKNEPRTQKGSRSPFRECVFCDLWWFRRLWEPLRIANASPILEKSSKGSPNNIFQLGRWCVWTMPASVLWRSTVFHFFVKNVDTHETLAGIAICHFLQPRGPLLWGPGTHFDSFCLPFWCLFQARAKKWKMRRRLSENPPFSDLEGHFFEPFPASIRKRSHNIPSLPFLWDFSIFLALPGDVPEPTKKKNTKKLQKTRFVKYYRHYTVCLWTK